MRKIINRSKWNDYLIRWAILYNNIDVQMHQQMFRRSHSKISTSYGWVSCVQYTCHSTNHLKCVFGCVIKNTSNQSTVPEGLHNQSNTYFVRKFITATSNVVKCFHDLVTNEPFKATEKWTTVDVSFHKASAIVHNTIINYESLLLKNSKDHMDISYVLDVKVSLMASKSHQRQPSSTLTWALHKASYLSPEPSEPSSKKYTST